MFTIGSPLNQQKVITSGIAGKIEKTAIISDININHGNSGGPLFNSQGQVVGITTFGDFTSHGGPGISGILRIDEAVPTINTAKIKMVTVKRPVPSLLPVEPGDSFPIDALKSILSQEKFDTKPYFFGVGDFDITLITPPLKYRAESESEMRAAKEKNKRNRKSELAVQDSFRPLDDVKNWEQYIGEYKSSTVGQSYTQAKRNRRFHLSSIPGCLRRRLQCSGQDAFQNGFLSYEAHVRIERDSPDFRRVRSRMS